MMFMYYQMASRFQKFGFGTWQVPSGDVAYNSVAMALEKWLSSY